MRPVIVRNGIASFGDYSHRNTNKFFSQSWPYETISPLTAYILGVLSCVIIFVVFNFIDHPSFNDRVPRGGRLRKSSKGKSGRRHHWNDDESIPATNRNRSVANNSQYLHHPNRADERAMLSNDKVYRRLTSRMRDRKSTRREHWKTKRLAKKIDRTELTVEEYATRRKGSRNYYDNPTKLICHFVDHHPIARSRARYNQKQAESRPLTKKKPAMTKSNATESAYYNSDIWSSRASAIIDEPSYELFKIMNSQPMKKSRVQQSCTNDVIGEVKKNHVSGGDVVNSTKSIVPNVVTSGDGLLSSSYNKENVDTQLMRIGDVNDTTPKMKNGISKNTAQGNKTKSISTPHPTAKSPNNAACMKSQGENDDEGTARIIVSSCQSATPKSQKDTALKPTNDGVENVLQRTSAVEVPKDGTPALLETTKDEQSSPHKESIQAMLGETLKGNSPSADESKKSHLTILISNGVCDYTQAANQKAALDVLNDLSIPYKIIDGMDPSMREKRNSFFEISKIRGNYPQLFSSSGDDAHIYLGGIDWLNSMNIEDLKAIVNVEKEITLAATHLPASTDTTAASLGKTPKMHLTILISKGVCDYTQAANQKAALDLLNDLSIPYDIVDGMDPEQKEKRDSFFLISGIRGNYPQLFSSVEGGGAKSSIFLGGYDWLLSCRNEFLEKFEDKSQL